MPSGRLNPSGQRRGLGVFATTPAERLLWEEVHASPTCMYVYVYVYVYVDGTKCSQCVFVY